MSVPHKFTYGTQLTSYLPPAPPKNDVSSPENVTPIESSTPHNNPPKPVSHVQNDHNPDPSSSDSSSLELSDSLDQTPLKIAPSLLTNYLNLRKVPRSQGLN